MRRLPSSSFLLDVLLLVSHQLKAITSIRKVPVVTIPGSWVIRAHYQGSYWGWGEGHAWYQWDEHKCVRLWELFTNQVGESLGEQQTRPSNKLCSEAKATCKMNNWHIHQATGGCPGCAKNSRPWTRGEASSERGQMSKKKRDKTVYWRKSILKNILC